MNTIKKVTIELKGVIKSGLRVYVVRIEREKGVEIASLLTREVDEKKILKLIKRGK